MFLFYVKKISFVNKKLTSLAVLFIVIILTGSHISLIVSSYFKVLKQFFSILAAVAGLQTVTRL